MLRVGDWIVMLPGGGLPGILASRLVSKNSKSFGDAAQTRGVLDPVLLTRVMFRLNRIPSRDNGVDPSLEKADIRRVLIGPAPGITFAETFQVSAVSPAADTGGCWKVTIVESKVKSPWNPIRLELGSIAVVDTG